MSELVYEVKGRTLTFTGKDAEARHLAHVKVGEFLASGATFDLDPKPTHQRIVWSYWEQGWTNAPSIVQSCGTRMLGERPDFDVRLLDETSVRKFIHIDDTVAARTSKWKAHYADVLRAHLLAEYGGVWIDATVLVTQPLDSLFRQVHPTPFFAYTVTKFLSSWLLIARKGDIVPVALRDFFIWYWRNHEELPHYFWFHLCFEALYAQIPEFCDAWDRAIIQRSPDAHALQKVQLEPINEYNYHRILRTTHVQKMTYRFKDAPAAPAGSYLEQVFKDFAPVPESLPTPAKESASTASRSRRLLRLKRS